MYEIQTPVPLSASALWRLQTLSYESLGMTAWARDRTPSYITSNPHFAEATARVIFSALVDLAPLGERVTLIELGAGSGRFSWLLLEALSAIEAASPLKAAPWRLVMTDVATSLLRAWRRHPQLAPHVASGRLDFARFDVAAPSPLHLRVREEMISRGPWIVLANYLWDSVPQDAYEVGGGQVQALHVGLLSTEDPALLPAPEVVRHIRLLQQRQPLSPDIPPPLRALLHEYAEAFAAPTTVLLPTAAMGCLAWLADRGPVVVLSADKGVSTLRHLEDGERLPVTLHGGTASMTVDFQALSRWTVAQGGWTRDGDPAEPLFLHHLAVLGLSPEALSRGLLAFEQAFSVGSGYALYQLSKATADEGLLPSLPRLQAMLTLTHGDPDLVWTFSRALRAHIDTDPAGATAARLVERLAAAGTHVYALPEDEDDVDALIAELAAALSAPEVAEVAWQQTIDRRGPSATALHGRAVALSMLGRPAEALVCVQQALTLPISHQHHAELSQWSAALQAWATLSPEELG